MISVSCDDIRGAAFRPLFDRAATGRPLGADELEEWIRALPGPPVDGFSRRWDEDEGVLSIDFRRRGISHTAGLYKGELTFVNIQLPVAEAGIKQEGLTADEAIACLGAPAECQAWYEWYPNLPAASLHAALVFTDQRAIAFASCYYSAPPADPPRLDGALPVHMIAHFGDGWAEDQKILARSFPWPGRWEDVHVDINRHEDVSPLDKGEAE